MKFVPFVATIAAMAVSQPALANDAEPLKAKSAKTEKSSDRLICRSVDRVGSNIKDRVCLTREKWNKVDEYLRTGNA